MRLVPDGRWSGCQAAAAGSVETVSCARSTTTHKEEDGHEIEPPSFAAGLIGTRAAHVRGEDGAPAAAVGIEKTPATATIAVITSASEGNRRSLLGMRP